MAARKDNSKIRGNETAYLDIGVREGEEVPTLNNIERDTAS